MIRLFAACLMLALSINEAVAQWPGLPVLRTRGVGVSGTSGPPPQTISSITPTSCSVPTGGTGTCATMTVTMSNGNSPAFSGTLSVGTSGGGCTDTTAGNFVMSGANLNLTNASIATGSYTGCVMATQTGISNSPFVQAVTITVTSAVSATFVANTGTTFNVIDGFGAAGAFTYPPDLTASEMDQTYCSLTNYTSPCAQAGIGLIFYRDGVGDSNSLGDYKLAAARGAKTYVMPWGIDTNSANWSAAISNINSWISTLSTNGVPTNYIVTQNEPDCGCNGGVVWTPSQTASFIDQYAPALPSSVTLVSPEIAFATNYGGFISAIEGDSTANAAVKVFSYHLYGGTLASQGQTNDGSRHLWETEMYDSTTGGDNSIGEAVGSGGISQLVWSSIVGDGASAFFYWYIDDRVANDSNNEGLFWQGQPSKRTPAFGNWSAFVRPGWKRIAVTGSLSGMYGVTAFVSPTGSSGGFAVIAINSSGGTLSNVTFGISGASISGTIAPWVTSGTAAGNIGTDGNLSNGSSSGGIPTSITPSGNVWTASVPYGVTTFVGKTN